MNDSNNSPNGRDSQTERNPQESPLQSRIFRTEKRKNYFKVNNDVFSDSRLSWEARGVLGYILSKPDDWIVRNGDLVKRGEGGVKKMERILRELKKAGYLRRHRYRKEGGQFEWVTEVYESPSLNPDFTIPPSPSDGEPPYGQPSYGQPSYGQGGYIVNTDLQTTDLPITEEDITEGGATPTSANNSFSALEIYQSVTKIKKAENIPEAVTEWLEEQEQYMASHGHPEALRQTIVQLDREGEKQIFDTNTLDYCFSEACDEIPD